MTISTVSKKWIFSIKIKLTGEPISTVSSVFHLSSDVGPDDHTLHDPNKLVDAVMTHNSSQMRLRYASKGAHEFLGAIILLRQIWITIEVSQIEIEGVNKLVWRVDGNVVNTKTITNPQMWNDVNIYVSNKLMNATTGMYKDLNFTTFDNSKFVDIHFYNYKYLNPYPV